MLKGAAGAAASAASPPAIAEAGGAPHPSLVMPASTLRERLLMDFGWRFAFGHACDPAKDFGFGKDRETFAKSGWNVAAPATDDFDDSAWQAIDLPHDWAVALPFVPSANPPQGDDPRAAHGYKPLGRDYPETSIGWYRRRFDIAESDRGRRLSLEFDGVFRDCLVVLNGYIVGGNESGYAPFSIDVTDYVNYGGANVLVLRVDATLGEGWFYEGAGVYRHVWLVKTHPVHSPQWGVCVRSTVGHARAAVTVETEVVNAGPEPASCRLNSFLFDPAGEQTAALKPMTVVLAPGESRTLKQQAILAAPVLWSLDRPSLYRAKTLLHANGHPADDCVTTFGIRSVRFDPVRGFFLNGEPVKLKGICNHQDHAGVGTALPDRLHAFRIEKLKAMGSNAYRCAHNPPAPELLDACDRLGMLVIDETRMMASDEEGLSQLSRMIRRDRNHPCVILWSIGNEEHELQGTPRGASVAKAMKACARALDPTRPITAAVDDSKVWGIGITSVLDVLGCNYRTDKIPAFHAGMPGKPTIGTETGSTVCTRGEYARDESRGFVPAYDTDAPWWATTAEAWWKVVAPAAFIGGGFVWTGFDYRGEPTPFNRWPNVASQFGIMDSCGFPKDNWFYYRAQWSAEPLLHLFPHWNWNAGEIVDVWCHSNLDAVELFVNGTSAGVKSVPRYGHVQWQVPFAPGAIEARGSRNGQVVLADRRETAGPAARIVLAPDRASIAADGEDVSIVGVAIADASGRIVPAANDAVAFAVTGPAKIIGVGNGDPTSHEPDKAGARRAFNGLCMAIVQAAKSAGDIQFTASAPGLAPATVTIAVVQATPRPAI